MNLRGQGILQYDLFEDSIASGGEGLIYDVKGRPNLVAKLYRPEKANSEKEHKLIKMIKNPPVDIDGSDLPQVIAWPQDVLYDNGHLRALSFRKWT